VSDLEEAVRIAGPGRMACNQVLYHLKERAISPAEIERIDRAFPICPPPRRNP